MFRRFEVEAKTRTNRPVGLVDIPGVPINTQVRVPRECTAGFVARNRLRPSIAPACVASPREIQRSTTEARAWVDIQDEHGTAAYLQYERS